jgi:hypothetical protein
MLGVHYFLGKELINVTEVKTISDCECGIMRGVLLTTEGYEVLLKGNTKDNYYSIFDILEMVKKLEISYTFVTFKTIYSNTRNLYMVVEGTKSVDVNTYVLHTVASFINTIRPAEMVVGILEYERRYNGHIVLS